MAKFHKGSLVLDPNDKIKFTDTFGNEKTIYWDEILENFHFNGDIRADHYVGSTPSVMSPRNPENFDNDYHVPTIWTNETTKEMFILASLEDGVAIWRPLFGADGNIGGTIAIYDEGRLVNLSTRSINFIGGSVESIPSSPNGVNIYVPSYIHPSHFNTGDGTIQCIVPDIPTVDRYIANPTDGIYSIGNWSPGTLHKAFYLTNIIYETPEPFIIDNTMTTIRVTVLNSVGTVMKILQTQYINNNMTFADDFITIMVSDWKNDVARYSAKMKVDIDISSIIPNGGRFSVKIEHVIDDYLSYIKEQNDIFYDTNFIYPSLGGTDITPKTPVIKYISGIPYYGLNSTFDTEITGIDHINRISYLDTFLQMDLSMLSNGIVDINSVMLNDWTSDYDNTGASYSGVSALTVPGYRLISKFATVGARWLDWVEGPWLNSPNKKILIDTVQPLPTNTYEPFDDESKRLYSNYTPYNSQLPLSVDQLMVQSGKLGVRKGKWDDCMPTNAIDYSPINTDNQQYIRGFSHPGVSHSNGILRVSGIFDSDITTQKVFITISLDGVNWYSLTADYLGGVLVNNSGCRVNADDIPLPDMKFTLGFGGSTTASTGPDGWGIYVKIMMPYNSPVEIDELQIIDWSV